MCNFQINENIEVDERKTYTKEASLVLSQVTSLEGALPVLSVIPEVAFKYLIIL